MHLEPRHRRRTDRATRPVALRAVDCVAATQLRHRRRTTSSPSRDARPGRTVFVSPLTGSAGDPSLPGLWRSVSTLGRQQPRPGRHPRHGPDAARLRPTAPHPAASQRPNLELRQPTVSTSAVLAGPCPGNGHSSRPGHADRGDPAPGPADRQPGRLQEQVLRAHLVRDGTALMPAPDHPEDARTPCSPEPRRARPPRRRPADVLMTVSGTAWAFWTVTGAGTGSAPTATLAAPSSVTATAPPARPASPSPGPRRRGRGPRRLPRRPHRTSPAASPSPPAAARRRPCSPRPRAPTRRCRTGPTATPSSRSAPGWTATSASSNPVTVLASVATSTSRHARRRTRRSSASPSPSPRPSARPPAPRPGRSSSVTAGPRSPAPAGPRRSARAPRRARSPTTSAGTRSITATYAGSAPYAASSSASLSQVVGAASTTTASSRRRTRRSSVSR